MKRRSAIRARLARRRTLLEARKSATRWSLGSGRQRPLVRRRWRNPDGGAAFLAAALVSAVGRRAR